MAIPTDNHQVSPIEYKKVMEEVSRLKVNVTQVVKNEIPSPAAHKALSSVVLIDEAGLESLPLFTF